MSKIIILFLSLGIFVSCGDDDTEVPFEVLGDSFMISRVQNNDVVFAMAHYVYGNQPMSEAKVTDPMASETNLEAISQVKNIYAFEPTLTGFTDMPGEEGTYLFDVVNEGIPHQASDEVVFDFMDIPVIDTAYWVGSKQVISVEWTPDGVVQNYMIKMTELDGELVFQSRLLSGSVPKYEIQENIDSWFKFVEGGKTYIVELHAILYEDGATNDDYLYNIQEMAVGTIENKWGE